MKTPYQVSPTLPATCHCPSRTRSIRASVCFDTTAPPGPRKSTNASSASSLTTAAYCDGDETHAVMAFSLAFKFTGANNTVEQRQPHRTQKTARRVRPLSASSPERLRCHLLPLSSCTVRRWVRSSSVVSGHRRRSAPMPRWSMPAQERLALAEITHRPRIGRSHLVSAAIHSVDHVLVQRHHFVGAGQAQWAMWLS